MNEFSEEGFDISSQLMNENVHDPSQNLLSPHNESQVIPRVVHSPINLDTHFSTDHETSDNMIMDEKERSVTPDLDPEGNILLDSIPSTAQKTTEDLSPTQKYSNDKNKSISQDSNKENDTTPTQKFKKISPTQKFLNRSIEGGKKNLSQDTTPTQKFLKPSTSASNSAESTQVFKQRLVSETQKLDQTIAFHKRNSLTLTESTQEFRKRIVNDNLDDIQEDMDADASMLSTQAFQSRHSSTMMVNDVTQVNKANKKPIFLAPDSEEEDSTFPIEDISAKNAILDSTDEEDVEIDCNPTTTKGKFGFLK